jgi:hypothetical protein
MWGILGPHLVQMALETIGTMIISIIILSLCKEKIPVAGCHERLDFCLYQGRG